MSRKEDILARIRKNVRESYNMPDLSNIKGIQYPDVIKQFEEISRTVGGQVVKASPGQDINAIIKEQYPDAKVFASNLPEITIASKNPDILEAHELNGTDVGIIKGQIGVAENGCIWIPQTMKERAICFISEYLVIIISRKDIVNNMHEAYSRIKTNSYGYGCFISGPSKTADIAQALVMGAQAARGVTVIITE